MNKSTDMKRRCTLGGQVEVCIYYHVHMSDMKLRHDKEIHSH